MSFWLLAGLVVYVYIGYPLILRLLAPRGKATRYTPITPRLTILMAAYNEATVIRRKLENSLVLDYPPANRQIIVASDGSDDGTVGIAKEFASQGIDLIVNSKRRGKSATLNQCIPHCTGDILVFTDADCFLHPGALKALVQPFSDDTVGCVVGHLKCVKDATLTGSGEGLYVQYESMLKRLESALGTLVAATGALYAIRKSLFVPLDPDVANDLVHPIQTAAKGYQIVFEPEAVVYEQASATVSEEFGRRVRTVTRGLTAFLRYWKKYSMLKGLWGFCFISHKLLRWCVPLCLIALFVLNMWLYSRSSLYSLILWAQVGFYGLALLGVLFRNRSIKPIAIPFYFCLINAAAVVAICRRLAGHRQAIWQSPSTMR